MKKNRNTYFQESSYQSFNPNMNHMGGAPYQTASNYFYQGEAPMPYNYNTYKEQGNNINDIESRLSKIERQINRLDYRISKLENGNKIISSDDFENNSNNMYML